MASIDLTTSTGGKSGSVELDDGVFGREPNVALMHQVVTAQLAARRRGTQSTKTRAEVRGGGAKPWRQKGTGRSRQGSTRSPQWVGGGVALGPKPRSYAQRTPKKMVRAALYSALSDRAADERVVVLDSWGLDTPSTKGAVDVLDQIGVEGHILVVLTRDDEVVWKSLRNLGDVHVLLREELNAYDVLCSDYIVFTSDSLPTHQPVVHGKAAQAPAEAAEDADSDARSAESPKGDDQEAQ
jgi:large subunit ribosomal protein L4